MHQRFDGSEINTDGRPQHPGQVARQAGAIATAVKTKNGLRWQVRRQRDGLIRITACLAHTSHWTTP
ncbi:MAG TPA: hypothetical protein VG187_19120 [Mycobacterium sp.]|jgi:hypothetical protein|nr:hypothetical protein [Mycobacterium sp.]